MPTSSTVWWAPVSRSPVASTRKPRRPWRPSSSSMWSKKPTPGRDRDLAPVEGQLERDLRLVGLALDLWQLRVIVKSCSLRVLASAWYRPADSPCTGKPSARARAPTCGASCGGGGRVDRDDRAAAAEGADPERPAEPRRAARRQDVVGARRVVAERRGAARADEDAAGDAARARRSRRRRRRQARGARARTRRRAAAPPRGPARRRARAAPRGRSAARPRARRPPGRRRPEAPASGETSTSGLSSPCSAWAARSSAIQSARPAVASATTSSSLGPAMPSMPTRPETRRLASFT